MNNLIEKKEIDALVLLEPFLEVIRSGDTNGPITAAALGSVEKFLTYRIINKNSPNLPLAMSRLSSAATHCQFEASDSISDEFVLLKILHVLRLALICEVGRVLSDEALCEMMETGLSMCCQMRLSGIIKIIKPLNKYMYIFGIVNTINLIFPPFFTLFFFSSEEMLRRSAEHTMIVMVQTMFERYFQFIPSNTFG